MPKEEDVGKISKHFGPGGKLAPIEDRAEYERQMNALPAEQRALAEELTRYADLCRYFADHDMQMLPHIVRAVAQLSSRSVAERTTEMQHINQEVMEYLESVSEDPEFRM
jgi:uncharacterized protein (UPF0147 family)